MNTALFYDTETTGLPLFSEPSEHPDQPHIVQLAATLVNMDTRRVISSIDVIVRPDGWTIPEKAVQVHGITTEMAGDLGIPESQALDIFLSMWRCSNVRIGHNESFDSRIVRIAIKRFIDALPQNTDLAIPLSDEWKAGKAECTQKIATPIVKAPATERMIAVGRTGHKPANLSEAYKFFTGNELQNAHSAMADVRGCIDVYFGAQDHLAKQ
jgi:DNA polymerase-3 subunit epsilon